MEFGFASYTGPDFLGFYVLLLIAAEAASWWMEKSLRPQGNWADDADAELLAYLGGGPARFADCVLAALIARGDLQVLGKEFVPAKVETGETPAERSLLRDYKGFGWSEVLQKLRHDAEAAEQGLVQRGLLLSPSERTRLRLLTVAPLLVVATIGVYRLFAGMAQQESVGWLLVMLVMTLGLAAFHLWKFNPRTQAGDVALEKAKEAQARLKSAPREGELGFAVALFGTSVLMGTPYSGLHDARHAAGGAGGYAGDGSGHDTGSDGGAGCGGGGCGGCGG